MPIIKIDSRIEEYRLRAKSKDLNELSGRTNRKDLTSFISKNILNEIDLNCSDALLDIGCGDGTLLLQAASVIQSGIGILPTIEEVKRVRNVFADVQNIQIQSGIAQKLDFPTQSFNKIVCNGVMLFFNENEILHALAEINRVSRKNSIIFIGEIPRKNEFKSRNYGNSIIRWLLWVLKNQGSEEFVKRTKQVMRAFFSDEPLIVFPKKHYFSSPANFIKLAESSGLKLIKTFKHKTLSLSGEIMNCPSRQNYIFKV